MRHVATIRTATWEDFDEIVDLIDARSRAAFGTDQRLSIWIKRL